MRGIRLGPVPPPEVGNAGGPPTNEGLLLPVSSPASVRRYVVSMLRSERRGLTALLLIQGVATLAGLVGPRVLGSLVDVVADHHGTASTVFVAVGIFAGALLVQAELTRIAAFRAAVLGERLLADLRDRFVSGVLKLPLGVVERAGTGDLLTRATNDVGLLSRGVQRAVPEILIGLVSLFLTVVALIVTAPELGVVLVPSVPLLVLGARWYLRRAPAGYRAEQAALSRVNARLQESVAAGRTIEAFRLGRRRIAETDTDIASWLSIERYTLGLRSIFFPITEAAYVIPLVLAIILGGLLHADGSLSLGAVTAAALYAQMLVNPLDLLLSWTDEIELSATALARLLGVEEVPEEELTDSLPEDEVVEATGVAFSYGEDHEVLRGVDLRLDPGSRLAVIGPSGAGKSTIALLLAGVYAPSRGRVAIGGVNAHELPTTVLRREIALVTQEQHVFAATLAENLAIAKPDASPEELVEALRSVDALSWTEMLPQGLETVVGSGGFSLAPAEAQQLALARLVLADPHTLILDEATSLLDPGAARHLERSLAAVLTGRTVVAIAHRLQTARDADLVAVVAEGRIAEIGSHEQLLATGGTYAQLWHAFTEEG